MTTYLVALAIEVSPVESNPIGWDWAALLDTPLSASCVVAMPADDAASTVAELRRLAAIVNAYADGVEQ